MGFCAENFSALAEALYDFASDNELKKLLRH